MVYGQVQGMALLRKFCCENPHGADVIGAFHVFEHIVWVCSERREEARAMGIKVSTDER